jgi:hypothetical protein
MSSSDLVVNDTWSFDYDQRKIALTVSRTSRSQTSIVAITETGGIGSIFDASVNETECYLGTRGDGLSEAFARALISILGTQHVLLTLAVRNIDQRICNALLETVRDHAGNLK